MVIYQKIKYTFIENEGNFIEFKYENIEKSHSKSDYKNQTKNLVISTQDKQTVEKFHDSFLLKTQGKILSIGTKNQIKILKSIRKGYEAILMFNNFPLIPKSYKDYSLLEFQKLIFTSTPKNIDFNDPYILLNETYLLMLKQSALSYTKEYEIFLWKRGDLNGLLKHESNSASLEIWNNEENKAYQLLFINYSINEIKEIFRKITIIP